MPTVFFELLLAHLLGDFVFQSNDLIQRKYKSWLGTFEHVCIIAFFTILFLFPYWNNPETWIAVILIFATHFIQDVLKIKYDIRYNKKKSTLPFFVDQILHISLIVYLSYSFQNLQIMDMPNWVVNFYVSRLFTMYCLGLVIFSFVIDITAFQFARKKAKKSLTYKPDTKAMKKRIFWFSIAYVLFLVVNRSFM